MIQFSNLDLKPDRRKLRQFAGVCAGCLCVCAWKSFSHFHGPATWMFALAALATGIAGIFATRVLYPLYITAIVITYPIGWLVSRALVCLLYYGLMTLIGRLFRLLGRDRLRLQRCSQRRESYWIPCPENKPERYLRQF